MSKKRNTAKSYKIEGALFYMVSIVLFLLYGFGPELFKHDIVKGLAIGYLVVAIGVTIMFIVKRKDKDFEADLEASFLDERVLMEKAKANAKILNIMIKILLIMTVVSVFYDYSFKLGGKILLWSYIVMYTTYKVKSWTKKD